MAWNMNCLFVIDTNTDINHVMRVARQGATCRAGKVYTTGPPLVFSRICMARSFVFVKCFVDRCLSFLSFVFCLLYCLFVFHLRHFPLSYLQNFLIHVSIVYVYYESRMLISYETKLH
jgi:hypothetical protein